MEGSRLRHASVCKPDVGRPRTDIYVHIFREAAYSRGLPLEMLPVRSCVFRGGNALAALVCGVVLHQDSSHIGLHGGWCRSIDAH
jgi:hypothetical protein